MPLEFKGACPHRAQIQRAHDLIAAKLPENLGSLFSSLPITIRELADRAWTHGNLDGSTGVTGAVYHVTAANVDLRRSRFSATLAAHELGHAVKSLLAEPRWTLWMNAYPSIKRDCPSVLAGRRPEEAWPECLVAVVMPGQGGYPSHLRPNVEAVWKATVQDT